MSSQQSHNDTAERKSVSAAALSEKDLDSFDL